MELNPLWPAAPSSGTAPGATCAQCVWHFLGGRGTQVSRCRRHASAPVLPSMPACPAFASALDCHECGACCREAFHTVELSPRDPFVAKYPELVEEREGRLQLPRDNGACACLVKGKQGYVCTHYADRPRSCRDFERGSENCLLARRRVGLTP